MNTQNQETKVVNSYYGWTAETFETVNGQDWRITTMKRSNGKIISNAQAGNKTDIGFSFMMCGSKRFTLISEKGKATEQAIRKQHAKALILFDEHEEIKGAKAAGKPYEVKEGQILFLNGYGQDEYSHDDLAVYKIEKTSFGTQYHTVNLKTYQLSKKDHIRNITEKFGIGIYYKEGDVIDEEALTNAVITAKEKEREAIRKREAEKLLNEGARAAKIEEGKKLVNIPESAKSVIIGELEKNESDLMTDYHGSSTEKVIYLAFSNHERNLFPEMRKAALNCEETKFLNDAPKDWEQKQSWSMGAGYFLGKSRYSGWNIKKDSYIDLKSEEVKERLYVAAAEGRYFAQPEEETTTEEVTGNVNILEYSAKAVVVFGDTKPIKDLLKSLGGRFNFRLRHPKTGERLAGWIFPKSKYDEIKSALD